MNPIIISRLVICLLINGCTILAFNSPSRQHNCCIWSNNLCNCPGIYFPTMSATGCRQDVTNFSALASPFELRIADPELLQDGFYSLIILDAQSTIINFKYTTMYLITANINIPSTCLNNIAEHCVLSPELPLSLPSCSNEYTRVDELKAFLLRQKRIISMQDLALTFLPDKGYIIKLATLYNKNLFTGEPSRGNVFYLKVCQHSARFDKIIRIKGSKIKSSLCKQRMTGSNTIASIILDQFPYLSITIDDISISLQRCELIRDFLMWPKFGHEFTNYSQPCSFNTLDWSIAEYNRNPENFVYKLKTLSQHWSNLLQVQMAHLNVVELYSDAYKSMHSFTDDDFIHPVFCAEYKRTLKEAREIAARAEMYWEFIQYFQVDWQPNLDYFTD